MLTGQAKTDYQREYMRKRRARSNESVTITPESVRPKQGMTVRPKPDGLSANQWAYIQSKEDNGQA